MSYYTVKLMNFQTLLGLKEAKQAARIALSAGRGRRDRFIENWSSKKDKDIFLCESMLQTIQDSGNTDLESVKSQLLDFWTVRLNLFDLVASIPSPSDPTVDSSSLLLLHYIGNWDASLNTFPVSGGSGPGTSIARGDLFDISVGGAPGGLNLSVGATIWAKVALPGQTLANWKILY